MLSANNYIKTGFVLIDEATDTSSEGLEADLESIQFLLNDLKKNQDEDINEMLNSVVYMTANYYLSSTIEVTDTKGVQIGDASDDYVQSIILVRQSTSDYNEYMKSIDTLKTKYKSKLSNIDYTNINTENWKTIVDTYYEARNEIIEKSSNVYASIRNAFMYSYGDNINLCTESINIDKSQLVSNLFKFLMICFI